MISKISLQQMIAGLQRPQATSPKAANPTISPRRPEGQALGEADSATASFEQQVRRGIAGIDPDDPRRRQRALRVLVEASLIREFGEHMGVDPAFHAVVDQVASTMDEEPALRNTIFLALDALLSPQDGS